MGESSAAAAGRDIAEDFDHLLEDKLGLRLRMYQKAVVSEVMRRLDAGARFIVVSMPTGSGKTLVEMAIARHLYMSGLRVLVVEPTRFLVDQMYSRLWSRVFEGIVGRDYEGTCTAACDASKRVVIATPRTSVKCARQGCGFEAVIVDEAHHMFGGKYYFELVELLRPRVVLGFTALLPTKRLLKDAGLRDMLGEPVHLRYDFKDLAAIDPGFEAPLAVMDIFDAEMDEEENLVYDLFFRGLPGGDTRAIKRLELELARYGTRAFCNSYNNSGSSISLGNRLEAAVRRLCGRRGFSHKARSLAEIAQAYGIKHGGVGLALVFTSRRATAYEFLEALVEIAGLRRDEVAVLTGELGGDERRRLIERARKGEIRVIISTRVGEEGVDIPEIELLVFSDITKSALRFYQRLGRLARPSSKRRLKYLVMSVTPGTREYDDLSEAVEQLYAEGVDISYIVVNLEEAGAAARVVEAVKALADKYHGPVPFPSLARCGKRDPLECLIELLGNDELTRNAAEALKANGVEVGSKAEAVAFLVLNKLVRSSHRVRELFDRVYTNAMRGLLDSSLARTLRGAVESGRLLYIYCVDDTAQLLAMTIRRLSSPASSLLRSFIAFELRETLALFKCFFPPQMLGEVKAMLMRIVDNAPSTAQYVRVKVSPNDAQKRIAADVELSPASRGADLYWFRIYYDWVPRGNGTEKDVYELVELNARAIGARVLSLVSRSA